MKRFTILLVLLTLFTTQHVVTAQIPDSCQGLPIVGTGELTEAEQEEILDGFCMLYGTTYFYEPGIASYDFVNNVGEYYQITRALYVEDSVMDDALSGEHIDLVAIGAVDGVAVMPCLLVYNKNTLYIQMPGWGIWDKMAPGDCVRDYHYGQHALPMVNPDGPMGLASSVEITYRYAQLRGINIEENKGGVYGVLMCITEEDPYEVCVGDPVDSAQWVDEHITYR